MRVIRAEQLTRSVNDGTTAMERYCTFTATCEIAGVAVQICTDMPEVARLFALRYADHPATRRPDFRYFVATVRGGYAFWCAHAATWRWTQGVLPADAVMFLADSVALSALIRYDATLCSMQAAAIEHNGIAAAIAGHSTTGKTTTLLSCARRGMRIYSDELAVMRDNVVYPFLRRCSVRATGARLLLGDRDSEPDPLRTSPDLSIKTCFGRDAIAQPGPLRALFTITGSGHCAALELVDTAAALPSVSRWFDARGDMVDRVSRAIAAIQNIRCYRLTLGSPDETSAAISYALTLMAGE